jgi:putative ABC transport system substrate-binding protein
VNVATSEMVAKRLQLLRELAPNATMVAMLQNTNKSYSAEFDRNFVTEVELEEAITAAHASGFKPVVIDAERDLEAAIDSAVKSGADSLFVSADPFFSERRVQIVARAARLRLPAVYPWRQYIEAGGLMSYGPSIREVYRQIGHYAGRILKGAKPDYLPVQMPTTFELILNLKAAKTLGLSLPYPLLVTATEVIE